MEVIKSNNTETPRKYRAGDLIEGRNGTYMLFAGDMGLFKNIERQLRTFQLLNLNGSSHWGDTPVSSEELDKLFVNGTLKKHYPQSKHKLKLVDVE